MLGVHEPSTNECVGAGSGPVWGREQSICHKCCKTCGIYKFLSPLDALGPWASENMVEIGQRCLGSMSHPPMSVWVLAVGQSGAGSSQYAISVAKHAGFTIFLHHWMH